MSPSNPRERPHRLCFAGILVALALAQCLGCSSAHRTAPEITLDPTHILVLPPIGDQGDPVVVMGDKKELFEEAIRRYEKGELLVSVRIYKELIARYRASRWIDLYHHNRGLIFMRLQDYRSALADFDEALRLAGHPRDRRDARFQRGIALAGMARWREAAETFDALSAEELSPSERVEVYVRAGICHQRAHAYDSAEAHYRRAQRAYQQTKDLYLQYHPAWAARAQYQLGDLFSERFAEIRLRLPLERMRKDLDEKARLLLKAQNAFLKTIRLKDRYWALAAGYRIGAIYEAFYADLHGAEVPLELNGEEREIYFQELKRHAAPLIRRAVEVYRKNLELAQRVGVNSKGTTQEGAQGGPRDRDKWIWVTKTEDSLRKLEAILVDLDRPATEQDKPVENPKETDPESPR